MKIITVLDRALLSDVLSDVSAAEYGDNLTTKRHDTVTRRDGRYTHTVTLKVHNSRGKGSRLGHSGRRTVSASWEAHRDFLTALFEVDPAAKVVSAMATYDGADDFHASFPDTAYTNVGSKAYPVGVAELTNYEYQDAE